MHCNNNNNNLLHLYSAFLDTQSALHSKGGISSSTTSVQHPPGWCDGSHSAPERPPHTSLLVERRQSDEANQCMRMIRKPWWSGANGRIWPGCRDYTLLFFEGHPGIFNGHRESGPWFNISSEGRCFLQYSVQYSSNLVFPSALPSRYWPGSTLFSFSGQPVLGCLELQW